MLSLAIPENDRQTTLNLNANKDTVDGQIATGITSYPVEVTGLFKDPLDVLGLYCLYLVS